ncbi:MAG: hypothetical protein IJ769_02385 [Clostridia bacterium]|nr:hypothetical protein [Clostridia bacterium]
MSENITGKIARKYMAHFLDSSFGGATPSWYRIGEDLEEFSVALNPDTEQKKNILGNSTFVHNGYEISADAEPFFARVGDPLFEKLQGIIDTQATDDGCKTFALEVHLWENGSAEGGTFVAYRQPCYVVPTSYGGDTSGYQIPFTISYVGDKVKGEFTPASGNTPASFVAD